MLTTLMDKAVLNDIESLENIFSSYTSNGFSYESAVGELSSKASYLKDLPEIIEELVIVPIVGEDDAHPVVMKLFEPSKLQKIFAIFKEISGKMPRLISVSSPSERSSINMVSMWDNLDDEMENGDNIEIKRYAFTFADIGQYQRFIERVSSYVRFFRMPKSGA